MFREIIVDIILESQITAKYSDVKGGTMKEINIGIRACILPTFKEFTIKYEIKKTDLIFTQRFLYENYIKSLELPCRFVFYEDYEKGEPTEKMINILYTELKKMDIDRIIGIGGGSIMDSAKMISYINVENIEDVFDGLVEPKREKKLVLIPTTCGTGSEMDAIHTCHLSKYNSVIGRTVPEGKADLAVFISQFLEKLPYNILLYTSADAIGHCVECFLAPNSNPFIDAFALEGLRINIRNYMVMLQEGADAKNTRLTDFQVASAYGGIALSDHPAGYAHACCMYINGQLNMPHGRMVALLLFPVLRMYAKKAPDNPKLVAFAKLIRDEMGIEGSTTEAIAAFDKLMNNLLPKERLRDMGMPKGREREYAQGVVNTQERLCVQGLVPLTVDDITEIFKELW